MEKGTDDQMKTAIFKGVWGSNAGPAAFGCSFGCVP